ncbi:MAG: hypothetical protein DRQ37_03300 [Gammaproteobacteria bacterium]|nr:MAG: hypothetical protein DRQ37_03300 [Gammaproteobacteria bacterium]
MKETVLDVLIYLFENYFDEDSELESDQGTVRRELLEAGFPEAEISKAFGWLEGLAAGNEGSVSDSAKVRASTRIYAAEETGRLDLECRGFLYFLEQVGVLDAVTRELVIDRVMALETDDIDLERLKWVLLMVLFNRPGKEETFAWMEDYVFENMSGRLH